MKPQNNKKIRYAYWIFSLWLGCCILTGTLAFFCLLRTGDVEISKMQVKTYEYDKIRNIQVDLTDKIEKIYDRITLIDTDYKDSLRYMFMIKNKIEYQQKKQIFNIVSDLKQDILNSIHDSIRGEIIIYEKILDEVNAFLQVKDSISKLKEQEDILRDEYEECRKENKKRQQELTLYRKNYGI